MPDAHISLHSCGTVLLVVQHSVQEGLRMDKGILETLPVTSDLAQAEEVEVAFLEGFPQQPTTVFKVFLAPQHSLMDADIERAQIQIYPGRRSAAAGKHSAAAAKGSSPRRLRHA